MYIGQKGKEMYIGQKGEEMYTGQEEAMCMLADVRPQHQEKFSQRPSWPVPLPAPEASAPTR